GVHSDIGGGYPEKDGGLSMIAFGWMMREAVEKGLKVDDAALQRFLAAPANGTGPDSKKHNSMKGLWPIVEFIPVPKGLHGDLRLNLFRRRSVPEGALIHESVTKRAKYTRPLPKSYTVET
ncbi:MAG: hypothetical protein EPO67_05080, partial [Reyranella sp.]